MSITLFLKPYTVAGGSKLKSVNSLSHHENIKRRYTKEERHSYACMFVSIEREIDISAEENKRH